MVRIADITAATCPPVVESPETLDLSRRIFDHIAQEADALQVGLNNDVDQMRGVRSVLHDVIQFSARAQVLAESCRRTERLGVMYGDFEAFDRDWQSISYKLRRIPEINQSAALQRIENIDKLDAKLNEIFKVKPHFDQHELLRATAALSDKLQRLAEDIEVEMVDPQLRRSLTEMARRTQSEAQMVSSVCRFRERSGGCRRRVQGVSRAVAPAGPPDSPGRRQPCARADRLPRQPVEPGDRRIPADARPE